MSPSLVEVRSLSHDFGGAPVLDAVCLEIAPASYTVLLGPSGSGKTTLLSILGGFLVPVGGEVWIDGRDCTTLAPARRPTTTVFQDYALFPHMSVGSNVAFGLKMRGVARRERQARARRALDMVGLTDAFHRRPHELSGGQRQRVALARALVVEPAVLLLDEPLGALDLRLRRQMQDELKAIQKRVGAAFVHVTHDQEEAMALADQVVVLNGGRIVDQGPPERVYARPRTRFSATFMGESTLIDGRVVAGEGECLDLDTPLGRLRLPGRAVSGAKVGAMVGLAIRPEAVSVGEPPAGRIDLGAGSVRDIVFQGSFRRVQVESATVPGLFLTARVPVAIPIAVEDPVRLHAEPHDLIVLED